MLGDASSKDLHKARVFTQWWHQTWADIWDRLTKAVLNQSSCPHVQKCLVFFRTSEWANPFHLLIQWVLPITAVKSSKTWWCGDAKAADKKEKLILLGKSKSRMGLDPCLCLPAHLSFLCSVFSAHQEWERIHLCWAASRLCTEAGTHRERLVWFPGVTLL